MQPLIELPIGDPEQPPISRRMLAALALAVVVLFVWATTMSGAPAASPLIALPQDATSIPVRPTAAPTTAAPTTTTSAAPAEPDREVEFLLQNDGSVIRVEPWTMRVIWESYGITKTAEIAVDRLVAEVDKLAGSY